MKAEKNRYDNAWKDIIRELFFEFLDFYFPELSREVDHTVPSESREKELAKLLPANQAQNRTADLLYRVRMNTGKERSLLLHIEVQNRKEEELARGWSEPFCENMLRFLDWMLQLPEELE